MTRTLTKRLFSHKIRCIGRPIHHGRRDEKARASGDDRPTQGDCQILALNFGEKPPCYVVLLLVLEGPDENSIVEPIPKLEGLDMIDERREESIVNCFLNVNPLDRNTNLA